MATVALEKNEVITNTPFLMRKLTITGGATALSVTHGEDRAPDIIISQLLADGAVPAAIAVVRTSATAVTIDTLVDNAGAAEVTLIWLSQASGGIS